MNILDIIGKKRDNLELNKEEIKYFVENYTNGNITDYQAAALVMAIYINGMSDEEITELTLAMANSGDVLNLSELGNVVDKHSTGGVGDKVTLILMPLVASLGIPVAKMSGRGLGITGGTIDKLESIPGYDTSIDIKTFMDNVKKHGISLMGQTLNLAPADKKLYALRDTINCTANIPLIASSIMSKKIASGANKIVIDVTYGSGAFMKTIDDARKLADLMMKIGKLANRETVCILTDMDKPLGFAVGNNLEVIEAIDVLKNRYIPKDVEEVILELGANMLILANKVNSIDDGKAMILENIKNGKGFEKLVELVSSQGGDVSYLEDTSKFKKAKFIKSIIASKSGRVLKLDANLVGKMSGYLGAGRIKKDDDIDVSVGFVFKKKNGDIVEKGDILGYIHGNDEDKVKIVLKQDLFIIG